MASASTTALGVVLALGLSGCASYSDSFAVIESDMAAQRFDAALQTLEQQHHPGRNQVVHFLNKAMLERMKGDFAASNVSFESAKTHMAELYGTSVREQALSFVVNDATRSYNGEMYEQVLLHLYMALNYLQLGDLINARVEALQVDERLREITQKTPENRYTEDALARYLTGMIYEERGEYSDAMISYRQAYEAYGHYQKNYGVSVPDYLKRDLLRLSEKMGLKPELRQYKKEFGIEKWMSAAELAEQGELVLILHNGLAPVKQERATTVVDPATGQIVRITVPYYQTRDTPVTSMRVAVGDISAMGEMVENIDAIALQNLEAELPGISVRAIARAVIKAQLARAARENAGKQNQNGGAMASALVGLAVGFMGVVTERADTRSWLTLPARIHLARLPLSPGSYTIKVDLLGNLGQIVTTQEYPNVLLRQGAKTYLSPHWIPSNDFSIRRTP